MIDLKNTWCETSSRIYDKLKELDYECELKFNEINYYAIDNDNRLHNIKYKHSIPFDCKRIDLVDKHFKYVEDLDDKAKELKEQYKTEDYNCVAINIRGGYEYKIIKNPYFICFKDGVVDDSYVLIHRKHQDILEACLDGSEIEWLSAWETLEKRIFCRCSNFIENYVEEQIYRVKPKDNSFNINGFENPPFEGEITKKINKLYYGFYLDRRTIDYIPCIWDSDGNIVNNDDREYSLVKRSEG